MKNICEILLLLLPLTVVCVKFVSLYFHLASDVEKRWLGHVLSEFFRRWQLLKDLKHFPSARSDPTPTKQRPRGPRRIQDNLQMRLRRGKKKETRLQIDMTLFKRFLHRALRFVIGYS